jgi:hypothetical protein
LAALLQNDLARIILPLFSSLESAMSDENTLPTERTQAASEPTVSVQPKLRLSKPHLLIARMLEPVPKRDQYGYAPTDNRPQIDMRVSKDQRRNALAIMDHLFKALEAKEFKIEIMSTYQQAGTYAVHDRHDRVALSITETYKKVEHIPTAKELREKENWSHSRIPKWDDVPTGKLTLKPGGPVDLSSEAAVTMLIEKAVADVEAQTETLRQHRKVAEEQQRQESLKQQAEQQEKARVAALGKAAQAFHEYRILMDYIEEVRRFAKVPNDQRREGQSLEEWLRWAEWRARLIHPIG